MFTAHTAITMKLRTDPPVRQACGEDKEIFYYFFGKCPANVSVSHLMRPSIVVRFTTLPRASNKLK